MPDTELRNYGRYRVTTKEHGIYHGRLLCYYGIMGCYLIWPRKSLSSVTQSRRAFSAGSAAQNDIEGAYTIIESELQCWCARLSVVNRYSSLSEHVNMTILVIFGIDNMG